MILYRFILLIVDYGKKTDGSCIYAYIYYSPAHIQRMYGEFCVFLSSEIQGRHNLHKTKEKPPSRNFVHDSGRMNISSVFVYIYIPRRARIILFVVILEEGVTHAAGFVAYHRVEMHVSEGAEQAFFNVWIRFFQLADKLLRLLSF